MTSLPSPASSRVSPQAIAATGEMADLVRAHDWAATPLGPIESWSPALLAVVNLVLASPLPSSIYWGPRMITLYNDLYRPFVSSKHPGALGAPASELWREAWGSIRAEWEAVLRDGQSFCHPRMLIPIEIQGQLRDEYWNYSVSPVYENGEVAGIINVGQNITVEVLSQMALKERERERDAATQELQQVLEATTDGVLSVDRDWRITYMNPRALEIAALTKDVVGKGFWETFPGALYEGSPYVKHHYRAMDQGIAGEFEAFYPAPLNIWASLHVRPTPDGIVIFFRDITEEKRVYLALRQQRERFELVAEASEVGFWFCDLPFDKLIWDDRVKEHFWLPAEAEVTIETFYQQIHPEDRERTRQAIADSVANRTRYDIEYRTVGPKGDEQTKYIRAIGRTFYDPAGNPKSFDGVTLDITENKRAEDSLRASEERYRVLTELNPQALWTADPQGRVLYANQRFLDYIGKDFVPTNGDEYLLCFHPDDRQRVFEVWSRSVMTGEDYRIDARLLRASDGAARWWHLRALPLRDESGAGAIQQWLGTATDVHEAHIAAQQLKEQYAQIDRLSSIVEASREFIGMSDLEGQPVYGNRFALQLVGLESIADLERLKIPDFFFPDDRDFIANHFLPEALRNGHAETNIRFRHFKTGQAIWMSFNLNVLRNGAGEPIGLATVSRDITAQRQAEAALLQSEKLAAVGRLASSIAHEINNPLEAITNLLFLARQSERLSSEAADLLEAADQELRRVSIIANQTLRFHKQATRPQAVSCDDLFTTVLSIYEGRLKNSDISVEKRKRATQPVVCFEGEIRQVLMNLAGNAIDAMPRGGRLLVRSRDATDWPSGRKGIILTVADNGSGISPETRARVFEAFFTTKGVSGTGLGLWVSAEIVARHQGRLRFRSSREPGHSGTVFTLFLPFDATLAE